MTVSFILNLNQLDSPHGPAGDAANDAASDVASDVDRDADITDDNVDNDIDPDLELSPSPLTGPEPRVLNGEEILEFVMNLPIAMAPPDTSCPICTNDYVDDGMRQIRPVMLACLHIFCRMCVMRCLISNDNHVELTSNDVGCPICRTKILTEFGANPSIDDVSE